MKGEGLDGLAVWNYPETSKMNPENKPGLDLKTS